MAGRATEMRVDKESRQHKPLTGSGRLSLSSSSVGGHPGRSRTRRHRFTERSKARGDGSRRRHNSNDAATRTSSSASTDAVETDNDAAVASDLGSTTPALLGRAAVGVAPSAKVASEPVAPQSTGARWTATPATQPSLLPLAEGASYGSGGRGIGDVHRVNAVGGSACGLLGYGGTSRISCPSSTSSALAFPYGSMGGSGGLGFGGASMSRGSFLMNPFAPFPSCGGLDLRRGSCYASSGPSHRSSTFFGSMHPMGFTYSRPRMLVSMNSLYRTGGLYGSHFGSANGAGGWPSCLGGMPLMFTPSSFYSNRSHLSSLYGGGVGAGRCRNSFFSSSMEPHSTHGYPATGSDSLHQSVVGQQRWCGAEQLSRRNTLPAASPQSTSAALRSPVPPPLTPQVPTGGSAATPAEKTPPPVAPPVQRSGGGDHHVHALAVVTGAADAPFAAVPGQLSVVVAATHAAEAAARDSSLTQLRDQWLRGHCCALVIACGAGQYDTSLALVTAFLEACFTRLATTASYYSVSVALVAVKDATSGQDLLRRGASHEPLRLASSPIYGPTLEGLTTQPVDDSASLATLLQRSVHHIRSGTDVVVCMCVLKQLRKMRDGKEELLVAALTVTLVAGNLALLEGFKKRRFTAVPSHLYRYAFYGGCHTVCAACVAADDPAAHTVVSAVSKMSEISNTAPRSGNVARFIEYSRQELEKYRATLSSIDDPAARRTHETAMHLVERMLTDAQRLQSNPRKEAAKTYTVKASP